MSRCKRADVNLIQELKYDTLICFRKTKKSPKHDYRPPSPSPATRRRKMGHHSEDQSFPTLPDTNTSPSQNKKEVSAIRSPQESPAVRSSKEPSRNVKTECMNNISKESHNSTSSSSQLIGGNRLEIESIISPCMTDISKDVQENNAAFCHQFL